MTVTRFMSVVLLVVGFLGASGGKARADQWSRMDRDFCELNENAQRLSQEIHAHYRAVPQYQCLSSESSRVLALVAQAQEWMRCSNRVQLQRDMIEAERLARHIQDELDRVDDMGRRDRLHRECRIDTRAAYRLAESVEDSAIDVRKDANGLPNRPVVNNFAPPVYRNDNYNYPPRPGTHPLPAPTYYNNGPTYNNMPPPAPVPAPAYNYPPGYERSTMNRPLLQWGTSWLSGALGS